MRYSVPVKFIAILLTALALTVSFVCALGIVQAETFGLYTRDYNDWVHQRLQWQAYDLASGLAERYACTDLSNCSTATLRQLGYRRVYQDVLSWSGFSAEQFGFQIQDRNGNMLSGLELIGEETLTFEVVCSAQYPVLVTNEAAVDMAFGKDYVRAEKITLDDYEERVTIRYYDSPKYTIQVIMLQEAALDRYGSSVPLVELLYNQRFNMMWILVLSLCLCSSGFVYLCCASGKARPGDRPRLVAINRLPLDIYLAVAGTIGIVCGSVVVGIVRSWLTSGDDFNSGNLVIVSMLMMVVAVLIIGFVYALVAQLKQKEFYWWKHTLLNRLYLAADALIARLPVVWVYMTVGILLGGGLVASAVFVRNGLWWPLVVAFLTYGLVVGYVAYAYGSLIKGARRMADGELENKIDTRYLVGSYGRCADSLNQLSEVAVVAAQKQMRSERMRTELITNVSHDIKTPLTSIINYVDLLRTAPSQEEAMVYLDVLGRQSQRMKKLIEDLLELSKATSGTMPVDIIELDLTETLNQALGEFSDKLTQAELSMVYTPPAENILIRGDGRLTWRVLSNLLSNAVKYAMPGTRVYLDVQPGEDYVQVSLKNISAEPLNVGADDLTERFVRGDTSRNTEGSGLGLNIAKSLMELQKGSLELTVDGDLFKVTLRFPMR